MPAPAVRVVIGPPLVLARRLSGCLGQGVPQDQLNLSEGEPVLVGGTRGEKVGEWLVLGPGHAVSLG